MLHMVFKLTFQFDCLIHPCLTHPRISTPHISPRIPTQKNVVWGCVGTSPRIPHAKCWFFFIPTKGLLLTIHQNSHPHAIPTQFLWIFTLKLLIHAQFTFENCAPHTKTAPHCIPTQSAMFGTRPHAKFWAGVGLWDRGVSKHGEQYSIPSNVYKNTCKTLITS